MSGFEVYFDSFGDLTVMDGAVFQPRTGILKLVGSGLGFAGSPADPRAGIQRLARSAVGSTFVGGSGRNFLCTGLPAPTSAAPSPTGWFRPTVPDEYANTIFTLVVSGTSAAEISDGTDIVATLTTGGTAPVGAFASTVYGELTYNTSTPFTLTLMGEIGGGGALPDCLVSVTAGTAQDGVFAPTTSVLQTSDVDADWTLVIDPSGSAELRYLAAVIATRATGSPLDPSGGYDATALGMATYNLTADEPVLGEPWRALVQVTARMPRIGYAYLEVIEAAGVLTAVNGPFFATTLPAATGETKYPPLAYCDGAGIEQYHTGLLIWEGSHYLRIATPTSGTAPGVAGDRSIDATNLYVCPATDTWMFVALTAVP